MDSTVHFACCYYDRLKSQLLVSLLLILCCIVQVREHAVSFFSSLCDVILAATMSPSHDLDTRLTRDLDSRSGSLKRKHVGSTPSLSEVEPCAVAEAANGSQTIPPGAVSEEDSSSSSLSACSSDLVICDDFPAHDTYIHSASTGSSSNSFAQLESESNRKPNSWDNRSDSAADCLAISETEFNRNVLPGPGGWMMCPNVSLVTEDVVRSLARVSSIGSNCSAEFEDSDDAVARSTHVCANVLVVSHGGFICQLLGHFADDFNCCLPGGAKIGYTVTPNAALSRFFVTVTRNDNDDKTNLTECARKLVWVRCVTLHDKDHLASDVDVEPLPTSEPVWHDN